MKQLFKELSKNIKMPNNMYQRILKKILSGENEEKESEVKKEKN